MQAYCNKAKLLFLYAAKLLCQNQAYLVIGSATFIEDKGG